MDGRTPTSCTCGCEHLERVSIVRPGRAAYQTDFLACVECRIMYFAPLDRSFRPLEGDWADRQRRLAKGDEK